MLKHDIVLGELFKMDNTARLLHYNGIDEPYVTSNSILQIGCWNCSYCGGINDINFNSCSYCKEEKFIVSEKYLCSRVEVKFKPKVKRSDTKSEITNLKTFACIKFDRRYYSSWPFWRKALFVLKKSKYPLLLNQIIDAICLKDELSLNIENRNYVKNNIGEVFSTPEIYFIEKEVMTEMGYMRASSKFTYYIQKDIRFIDKKDERSISHSKQQI